MRSIRNHHGLIGRHAHTPQPTCFLRTRRRSTPADERRPLLQEMGRVAKAYVDAINRGDFAAALGPAKRTVEILESVGMQDHPKTMGVLFDLAIAHATLHQGDQAEQYILRGLALNKKIGGHRDFPFHLKNLATIYLQQNRPDLGLRTIDQAIGEAARVHLPLRDHLEFLIMAFLTKAQCLTALKKPAESFAVIEEILQHVDTVETDDLREVDRKNIVALEDLAYRNCTETLNAEDAIRLFAREVSPQVAGALHCNFAQYAQEKGAHAIAIQVANAGLALESRIMPDWPASIAMLFHIKGMSELFTDQAQAALDSHRKALLFIQKSPEDPNHSISFSLRMTLVYTLLAGGSGGIGNPQHADEIVRLLHEMLAMTPQKEQKRAIVEVIEQNGLERHFPNLEI